LPLRDLKLSESSPPAQWRAEGEANEATPEHPKQSGHPKSETAKIKML